MMTSAGDDFAGNGQLVRVAERTGKRISITIDGRQVDATAGDSVLVAMLLYGKRLRDLEFGGRPRAGFCLMGACQDCWVWRESGGRIRACTTLASDGMAITTSAPALQSLS